VRRGELWRYAPPGSPRDRVVAIISSDGINDSSRAYLIGAEVYDADSGDILSVAVGSELWVNAGNLSRVYRKWLIEHVGVIDSHAREPLNTALRAALDL
jgi:hypothetical protein